MVWLHFMPQAGHGRAGHGQAGHGQAGHRPTLVLSPDAYNRIGLMLCCPMTTTAKGYPFEVPIAGADGRVVLADQVRSLDWQAWKAKRKGAVMEDELAQIRIRARAGVLIRGK